MSRRSVKSQYASILYKKKLKLTNKNENKVKNVHFLLTIFLDSEWQIHNFSQFFKIVNSK